MKSIKTLGLSLAVISTLGFVGCGGGGSSTPADDTQTGTFVDSPVQGLNYSTATQSGVTDSSGNFKYKTGETVEFKLGTLSLGSVAVSESINPLDLAGDTGLGSIGTKAKNIAMLLQNLDQNRSNTGSIIISSALKDHNFSALDLTSGTLEASMNALLADANISANIDQVNNTIITQATANTAMKTYLKGHIAGTYNGSITVTQNYLSNFTCSNETNYDVVVAPSGDNFTITAPITITENGVSTTRNVVWTTTILSNFTSSYENVASPLNSYSYKIGNIKFNGKKLTGEWYMKSTSLGNICDGTYTLSK
jgi:hypothetical protein